MHEVSEHLKEFAYVIGWMAIVFLPIAGIILAFEEVRSFTYVVLFVTALGLLSGGLYLLALRLEGEVYLFQTLLRRLRGEQRGGA